MSLFDENKAVEKSKYLVTLYLHKLQPSDRVISGGPLILVHKLKTVVVETVLVIFV